jgi:hypothetical protein
MSNEADDRPDRKALVFSVFGSRPPSFEENGRADQDTERAADVTIEMRFLEFRPCSAPTERGTCNER